MKLLTALFLFLSASLLSAQTVTVLDSITGSPLHMVTLSGMPSGASVTTDENGSAEIGVLKRDRRIIIRMLGYSTVETTHRAIVREGAVIRLSRESFQLGQAVAVSTRWGTAASEFPQHVSVITPRDAALAQPQTSADLLESSGEVFVQRSQQAGGSPMIRGFATNRVLIAVDGVRMNNAIFRAGNIQNVISIDPLAVERTDVVFGPGSVMYGSDAIGGVMSFSTLTPHFSDTSKLAVSGAASTRFSSANLGFTNHAHLRLAGTRWASVTSFSRSDLGDLRMGRFGPDDYLNGVYVLRSGDNDLLMRSEDPLVQRPSAYSQTNVMQKLRFDAGKGWELNYGFHWSATGDYGRYDRHLRTRNGLPRSAEWDYGPQVWMMNLLTIGHRDTTALYDRLDIRIAHQFFKESRIDRNLNSDLRRIREERVHAYSLNLDLDKALGRKHHLYYGAEGVVNLVGSIGRDEDIGLGTSVDGSARYPDADWAAMGAYLTYHFRASRQVLLTAGARYSHILLNARFDTLAYPLPLDRTKLSMGAPSGSVGMVWTPTSRWTVSVNAGTAFRAPNVDDIGKVFDSELGKVTVPNPTLRAEYAYNGELRVTRTFGHWLRVGLGGYITYLDGAMVRRDFTLNGTDSIMFNREMARVQAITNAASAAVYGIQAALDVQIVRGLSLRSRFNWQRGTEVMDDGTVSALRHAGPWFGTAQLSYRLQKLVLALSVNANGGISHDRLAIEERGKPELYALDADGNPQAPAWYTLNLRAMYAVHRHVEITIAGENLTDRRYRPYSSGMAAPGINLVVAVRAVF